MRPFSKNVHQKRIPNQISGIISTAWYEVSKSFLAGKVFIGIFASNVDCVYNGNYCVARLKILKVIHFAWLFVTFFCTVFYSSKPLQNCHFTTTFLNLKYQTSQRYVIRLKHCSFSGRKKRRGDQGGGRLLLAARNRSLGLEPAAKTQHHSPDTNAVQRVPRGQQRCRWSWHLVLPVGAVLPPPTGTYMVCTVQSVHK